MLNFTYHTKETAPDDAKEMLSNIENKYGFVPNLFSYMAEAPTTVEAYLMLNELVSKTSLTPAQQQIALLTASIENDCEFCTVAHRAFGKMMKINEQTLQTLTKGKAANHEDIVDPKDQALVSFTKSIVNNRGRPEQSELDNFINAGFNKQQILEVILAVTIKTLSNYINHLTQPTPNEELLAML